MSEHRGPSSSETEIMHSQPMRAISRAEIEQYREHGVVCLRGLFDPDWIPFLRQAAERGLAQPTRMRLEFAAEQQAPGRFFSDASMWTEQPDCRRFVTSSPAAEIAARLMGADSVCLFFDQWLIKEPGTPVRTPWHHDLPYWPVDGDQICSLWLALDPVDRENGAVEYIRGSHRWNMRYQAQSFTGDDRYSEDLPKIPDIEARRDELDIVSYDLSPGDCIVHHGLSVHGAFGNDSGQRRRALVTRWAGDDAVYYPREGIMPQREEPDLPPGAPVRSSVWPRIWPDCDIAT